MEIIATCKTYVTRVLIDMTITVLICAFLTILLIPKIANLKIFVAIITCIFVGSLALNIIREKYYITFIKFADGFVYMEYFRYNKKIKVHFCSNEIDLLYGGEFAVRISATALIFRRNKKRFLIQYQGGVWNKNKMIELYEFNKKERLK